MVLTLEGWESMNILFAKGNTELVFGDTPENVAQYDIVVFQKLFTERFKKSVSDRRAKTMAFLKELSAEEAKSVTIISTIEINHPVFGVGSLQRTTVPLLLAEDNRFVYTITQYMLIPELEYAHDDNPFSMLFTYKNKLGKIVLLKVHPKSDAEARRNLTQKEIEILQLTAHGHSVKQIADKLGSQPATVHRHRQNMMIKLGVSNMAELVNIAMYKKLI